MKTFFKVLAYGGLLALGLGTIRANDYTVLNNTDSDPGSLPEIMSLVAFDSGPTETDTVTIGFTPLSTISLSSPFPITQKDSGFGFTLTSPGGLVTISNPGDSLFEFSGGGTFTLNNIYVESGVILGINSTLTGNYQFDSLSLYDGSTASGTIALPASGDGSLLDINGSTTLSAEISGTGVLTFQGYGLVNMTNTGNSYNGGTVLNGTTIELAADGVLGSGSIVFRDNGKLAAAETFTLSNAIAIGDGGNFEVEAGKTFTMNNVISDEDSLSPGILTKLGLGTLVLSGENTFSGLYVAQEGVLQFAKNNGAVFTTENLSVLEGGTAAFNVGGADEFNATDLDAIKSLGSDVGGFAAYSYLGIDTTNATDGVFTYGGTITDTNYHDDEDDAFDAYLNPLGLVKLGQGVLELTGTNSYTNDTYVDEGTLRISSGGNLVNYESSYGGVIVGGAEGTESALEISGRKRNLEILDPEDPDAYTYSLLDTSFVVIGGDGSASMTISDGGSVYADDFVHIGGEFNGPSFLGVTGENSFLETDFLGIGGLSLASVVVSDQGAIYADTVYLGSVATPVVEGETAANMTVTGVGSSLNVDTYLGIGDGGSATLNMEDGATGTSLFAIVGFGEGEEGRLNIKGGASFSAYSLVVGQDGDGIVTIGNPDPDADPASPESIPESVLDVGGLGIAFSDPEEDPIGSGVVNVNGTAADQGVLFVGGIFRGGGVTAALNLNGGILRAKDDESGEPNTIFLEGFAPGEVSLLERGGIIDSNGVDIRITSPLGGVGKLTKTGEGTLELTGDNTYEGGTDILAGKLSVGSATALGATTGTVMIKGGTLEVQAGFAVANQIVLAGGTYVRIMTGDFSGSVDSSSHFTTGTDTSATILAGDTTNELALETSFSLTSNVIAVVNDGIRQSDVYELSIGGYTGEVFVLQLSVADLADGAVLGWMNGDNTWTNAIDGNTDNNELFSLAVFNGSFQEFMDLNPELELEDVIGAYGHDDATNSVWAVLNHNSEFAIVAVPEPSTYLLVGTGTLALLFFRRKKTA